MLLHAKVVIQRLLDCKATLGLQRVRSRSNRLTLTRVASIVKAALTEAVHGAGPNEGGDADRMVTVMNLVVKAHVVIVKPVRAVDIWTSCCEAMPTEMK